MLCSLIPQRGHMRFWHWLIGPGRQAESAEGVGQARQLLTSSPTLRSAASSSAASTSASTVSMLRSHQSATSVSARGQKPETDRGSRGGAHPRARTASATQAGRPSADSHVCTGSCCASRRDSIVGSSDPPKDSSGGGGGSGSTGAVAVAVVAVPPPPPLLATTGGLVPSCCSALF